MTGADTIALADIVVALLLALALVAIVSRRFAVPYTAALVVFGLLVAILAPPDLIHVTPELVLIVLVPGLVFEAAFRLDIEHVRPTLAASSLLAVPGVLIMAGLVAIVLHLAVAMPLNAAFLVGAMVSATDPVAVIASMRTLRAPERLATLVESESLFNDGTGIVLFTIALAGGVARVRQPRDLRAHGRHQRRHRPRPGRPGGLARRTVRRCQPGVDADPHRGLRRLPRGRPPA